MVCYQKVFEILLVLIKIIKSFYFLFVVIICTSYSNIKYLVNNDVEDLTTLFHFNVKISYLKKLISFSF